MAPASRDSPSWRPAVCSGGYPAKYVTGFFRNEVSAASHSAADAVTTASARARARLEPLVIQATMSNITKAAASIQAAPMILPYNTERNFRLLQSVASLLLRSREVIVYPLGDLAVPLHFLPNHEPRRGILVDIVSGAPYVNCYPGFVSIAKSLELMWYNVRITCSVSLEFYESRGMCKGLNNTT